MKIVIDIYSPAVIASYADQPHIIEQAIADMIADRINPACSNLDVELAAQIELAVWDADDQEDEAEQMPMLVALFESGEISVDRIVKLALEIIEETIHL